MREQLISFGPIFSNFNQIAKLKKELYKIKNGELKQSRIDCFEASKEMLQLLKITFEDIVGEIFTEIEIFKPSENYPPHIDGNGISFFIGLESGKFLIESTEYQISPFVLYKFDDRKLHNSNFCSIMLK